VIDPTHPLYGLSFPLIGITVKQRLGRVCLVWLHPGIERAIPVRATTLANESHVPVVCRLSVAGLQALLHVLSPLVCPNQEDAHEPVAGTQSRTITLSSTIPTVSRSGPDAVSSPDSSSVFVSPTDLGDFTPTHADGSQGYADTRLSGGARVSALVPDKITKRHREREAYVYVRQSTLKQVQHNQESRLNQSALVQRAIDLGWLPERIHLIDCDLGLSGQDSQRPGFHRLVAAVSLGKVGLILAYEASRLARTNTDWYTVLDLATVVGVLIADTEGIYDPRDYNDRLLLGLRGLLSEAELHTLRLRMDAGRQRQVEQGRYQQHVPTGLMRLEDGRVSKTPDMQVQRTIELVCTRFETLGSCQKVLRSLRDAGMRLPRHQRGGPYAGQVIWRKPTQAALSEILHNPAYAGAFVYACLGPHPDRRPGQVRQIRRPLEEWPTIHHGVYPAYITWEQFLAESWRAWRTTPAISLGEPMGPHGKAALFWRAWSYADGVATRCGSRTNPNDATPVRRWLQIMVQPRVCM